MQPAAFMPITFHVFRYVQSWIEKREVKSEKANLTILFERYVPVILEVNRVGRFKKITPVQEVSGVVMFVVEVREVIMFVFMMEECWYCHNFL